MRVVAIDIGGTAIKYGIYADSVIENTLEIETEAYKGGEHIFKKVCKIIDSFNDFEYIAISTAGQVNPKDGYIIFANENIPNYTGLQFKRRLEEIYKIPVFVENDVNAMALGEAKFGAGKKFQNMLCLTYGTGIGGAIILNQELFYGANYSAGEFGSIVTHGDVKKREWGFFDGCYEKYASVSALVKKAQEFDEKYKNGRIIFNDISKKEIENIINDWIDEVILGLVTIIHLFNPEIIILGGGIMEQEYVINRINTLIKNRIMPNYRKVIIKNAELSNTAGMYGAVAKIER